jgi:hypothetical protein
MEGLIMAAKHLYCSKEKEITELYSDMKIIKPIIIGNGKEGLAVTVPKLDNSVNSLQLTMVNLDRNVDKLIKQQDIYEGEKHGKAEIRKRNRWIIGILITISLSLMGTVGYLITLILNHINVVI